MSKIGRKPIKTKGVQIEVKGQEVRYKGSKGSGVHIIPQELSVELNNDQLTLSASKKVSDMRKREVNRVWGLHRALLANAIKGSVSEFEKSVEINGLGYKAVKSGDAIVFSLGYSHKIDFPLPKGVSVDIDKTGQKLTVKSSDRVAAGQVCSKIRSLREPEPYKGTGVKLANEVIIRKAGKTKS